MMAAMTATSSVGCILSPGRGVDDSGVGEIRTLGPVARSAVFKTAALDHSATTPGEETCCCVVGYATPLNLPKRPAKSYRGGNRGWPAELDVHDAGANRGPSTCNRVSALALPWTLMLSAIRAASAAKSPLGACRMYRIVIAGLACP